MAVATNTSPASWWDQDDQTVLTVVAILEEQADRMDQAGGGRGGR